MAINKRCIMECIDKDGKPRMATPLTELCGVCGANLSGWMRRRMADRLRYRAVLSLRARRMEAVTSDDHRYAPGSSREQGKVVDIRPHLKKRARAAKAARRSV